MSLSFVPRPAGAVVTVLQGAHDRLLALAALFERAIDQLAWSSGSLVLAVPVAVLALVLGAVVWRGAHPVAGVSVALAVQVAASTAAWSSLVRTSALVAVVALLAAPFAVGLALALGRVSGTRWASPGRSPRAAPVAVVLLPAAIVAVAVATGLAWSLAAVVVVAATSGTLLAGRLRPPRLAAASLEHVTIAFGVVLLAGLLGGPGLGRDLARTLPTEEVTTAAELLLVLATAGVVLLAAGRTLVRPPTGAAEELPADPVDRLAADPAEGLPADPAERPSSRPDVDDLDAPPLPRETPWRN